MVSIADVIVQFERLGVYAYVLPFLVTFAIVYGVLQKIELFEEDRIDAIIGIVAGFFVANYSFTTGVSVGVFLSNFFGAFAVVLVFLLGALLAAGLAGYRPGDDSGWIGDDRIQQALTLLGTLALVAIFISWGGLQLIVPETVSVDLVFLNTTNLATLVVVLGAIGLIYFIMGQEGD